MKTIGLFEDMPVPTNSDQLLRVGKGTFWKLYKASQTRSGFEWKCVGNCMCKAGTQTLTTSDILQDMLDDIDAMSIEELTKELESCGRSIYYAMNPDAYEEYTPTFNGVLYKEGE